MGKYEVGHGILKGNDKSNEHLLKGCFIISEHPSISLVTSMKACEGLQIDFKTNSFYQGSKYCHFFKPRILSKIQARLPLELIQ